MPLLPAVTTLVNVVAPKPIPTNLQTTLESEYFLAKSQEMDTYLKSIFLFRPFNVVRVDNVRIARIVTATGWTHFIVDDLFEERFEERLQQC